jgi:hypothetical protein
MAKLDFDARYTVAGYRGVAFWLDGYVQEWPEPTYYCVTHDADEGEGTADCGTDCEYISDEEGLESYDDTSRVLAVMVGDDRRHVVDVRDLTVIPEGGYCHGCGQVGCEWDT